MEKQTEIKTLQSLKGDTYFADTFSASTIDKMCENITNDFPILLNTEYEAKQNKKVEMLEKQVHDLKQQLEDQKADYEGQLDKMNSTAIQHMNEFGEKIVSFMGDVNGPFYDVVEEEFGIAFIIKAKHKNNIPLTEEEIDYLVKNLK